MFDRCFSVWAAGILLAAVCSPALAEETSAPIKVKMPELPRAIQKTIHGQMGKGSVSSIEKSVDHGETTYDVEIRKGGRLRSFTVDEDGALLDREVFLGETPEAVREAIKKMTVGAEIEGITKVLDEEKVSYGVEMTAAGKTRTFTLDENGVLMEQQIFPVEAPAPVQQVIRKEGGSGKVGDVTKVIEDGETTYEVDLTVGEKSRTVIIDSKGAVVSREEDIALRDTPEAVQAAIKDLLKDGKLGTVTKNIEDDGTSYDIEIKRGGKWGTTSLGADGKTGE